MMVCATTSLAYPKDHVVASRPTYIKHVTITSFFQDLPCSSLWPHDLWLCHLMWLMWLHDCDVTLVLTLSSKGKINQKKNQKKILNKEMSVQVLHVWHYHQEYSMKYIYSTSQISKLSLTLYTFSITGSVAGLFLTKML